MSNSKSIVFNVLGMHCTSCALGLEKKIISLPGILKCVVNFATEKAFVEFSPDIISTEEIINKTKTTGFKLQVYSLTANTFNDSIKDQIFPLVISWILTLLLAIPMSIHSLSFLHSPIIGFIVAGISIFYPGFNIIKSAWSSLANNIMGMDVLIALGATTAWFSALLPIAHFQVPDYSMTATMLISINLTGRLLESVAKGSASQSLLSLSNFRSESAIKQLDNGDLTEVSIESLSIGDLIHIKAGDKIPADGIIVSGHTSINESFLTGESLPVEKREGDYVFSTSLNLDGYIIVQIQKDVLHSLFAQTIKLIEETQSTKVPIQKLADKITNTFVPIIITISFLSFAVWFAFPEAIPQFLYSLNINYQNTNRFAAALSTAISVLVIACPCALGLATPMALFYGTLLGARKGILIRRGEAIQNLTKVDIIALDKTGTLTVGHPKLVSFFTNQLEKKDHFEFLEILTGLEQMSQHPLSTAVVDYAKEQKITPSKFDTTKTITGHGIEGTFNGIEWFAGSLKSTIETEITISDQLNYNIEQEMSQGRSLICLSNLKNKECYAFASFSDHLRPETLSSIQKLKQMNKKIIILTGDHKIAAQEIAKELRISSVIAECSPKQKVDNIKALQEQGYNVCFVGDGINDAAALETADVGVAMGTGTDIAAESGDLVLMTGSLSSFVLSFVLADVTFSKIKQNLFWAFFYNMIALPLAFLGLLHPIIAEIAMSLSSLTVICNSLLLSYKKI